MHNDYPVWADNLVKSFGKSRAVNGVSIAVPQGMIYGVLGPNGAGKTTSLRMLLGIIDPDTGERSLLGHKNPREVSHRVGYLPEERGLYPNMKATEAIAFLGAMRGLTWDEARRRGAAMLEEANMAHAIPKKIKQLSKGMAQLVQLLGSIVHKPDLIVLDEPFSGLDPVNQGHLEALIRAEQARGATILFSTHVMGHAERLCDRLTIIAKGERQFEGTVDEARGTLAMEARYIPSARPEAAANLLPADARWDGKAWHFAVADGAAEPLLTSLINAGHGIAGLSIQRASLHDAFVRIVGETTETEEESAA